MATLTTAVNFPVREYPYDSIVRICVVKRDPQVKYLKDVISNFSASIAPPEFQRPESWKTSNRKAFFQSLLMNRVEGNLVIVNIKQALRKLKHIAPNDRAVRMLKAYQEQGYRYVILDGNNRLKFLLSLINNEFQIPVGEYEYIGDSTDTAIATFHVTRGKQTFKDLPPVVQDAIEDRAFTISEYIQIGYAGLREVFLNCNSGVFPNPQELRNCLASPWAEYVRQIRTNIKDMLSEVFSNYVARYCGDDWITELIDYNLQAIVENEDYDAQDPESKEYLYSSITQTSKTRLYHSEWLSYGDQKVILDNFKTLADYYQQMVDEATELGFQDKSLKRKSTWTNLFWMISNGIICFEQAVEAVKLHEKQYQDPEPTWGDDEATFKVACDGTRKQNIEFRHYVLSDIVKKVTSKINETIAESLEV